MVIIEHRIHTAVILTLALVCLILLQVVAAAATYYVDATNGSNTDDGLSPQTPWKTVSKVNSMSFNPGDSILFKRGDMWRETLQVPSSGVTGPPITFGAYGPGEKPIITANDIVSNEGWSEVSPNVYSKPYVGENINQLFENSIKLKRTASAAEVDSPGEWFWGNNTLTIYGNPEGKVLEASVRWWAFRAVDKDYIILENLDFSGSKNSWHGGVYFTSCNNPIVRNCIVRDMYAGGIELYGCKSGQVYNNTLYEISRNYPTPRAADDSSIKIGNWGDAASSGSNSIVYNNTVYNSRIGISFQEQNGGAAYSNHVYNLDNCAFTAQTRVSNIEIHDNLVHDVYLYALTGKNAPPGVYTFGNAIQIGGATGYIVENISIYRNHVYNVHQAKNWDGVGIDGAGIEIDIDSINCKAYQNIIHGTGGDGICFYEVAGNNEAHNNIIWDVGKDDNPNFKWAIIVHSSGFHQIKIYNNVLFSDVGGIDVGGYTTNVLIKNNIIHVNPSNYTIRIQAGSHAESNYNLFYTGSIGKFQWNGTDYNNFDAWKINSGQDMNSFADDPLFVDIHTYDFHLTADSPCIDAGTDVGITQDFEGNPVPSGVAPDIGAYEYVSASNQPPLANAGEDQTVVDSDRNGSEQVTLDGSGSFDPDGTIVSFIWTEGGLEIANGRKPIVILSTGTHSITLTVTDNGGLTDTDTVTIKLLKQGEEFGKLPLGCYNNVINPLKGEETIIVVEMKKRGSIKIDLYDTKGNKIRELADEEKDADTHNYSWNGRDDSGNFVGCGLYFVHIQAGDYKKTKKIVVVK
jgi:parallel beta-helix repeat protein